MDHEQRPARQMTLLALGVVYGDIGTSPLYAFRTALAVSPEMTDTSNVLGILSLIIWALIVVVCIKYCLVILNADHRGEGGVLALSTLVLAGKLSIGRWMVGIVGLLGAALFFADGALTPAISVLSAVEGLTVGHRGLAPLVVPVTLAILLLLFRFQAQGTETIGRWFGPVMVIWFGSLALMGLVAVTSAPKVLFALNPLLGIGFLRGHGALSLAVIGAVFLAVTGGEALYADLGHFGKTAIRRAWFSLVMPALMLNYLGQGALVLAEPATRVNPFFLMVPRELLSPLVVLATLATVIASQAVVSGVFSVVHQAVRLSYLPRLVIRHFSATTFGQVYVPAANAILGVATAGLVLAFGSSEALAGAYGIAVAAVMIIATLLTLLWLWTGNRPERHTLFVLMLLVLSIDIGFGVANSLKIVDGGWVPVLIGASLFLIMNTWTRGRDVVRRAITLERRSVQDLRHRLEDKPPVRVPGTAVFLASNPNGVPRALWHNMDANNVLHERVILLSILTEEVPRVPAYRCMEISEVLPGITRVVARFGFMETPVVNKILYEASRLGVHYTLADSVFFVGSESVFYGRSALHGWEKRVFAFMLRNSRRASSFYGVPEARLIEIGARLNV